MRHLGMPFSSLLVIFIIQIMKTGPLHQAFNDNQILTIISSTTFRQESLSLFDKQRTGTFSSFPPKQLLYIMGYRTILGYRPILGYRQIPHDK